MNYIVIFWDAHGNPHQTERMTKTVAETFARSMFPEQEAQIVYVRDTNSGVDHA
jgi:hypothetical protein